MIFCILDRDRLRVIKVVEAENGVESRVLRDEVMEKRRRCFAVVCIQIALLLRIKKQNVLGSIQ